MRWPVAAIAVVLELAMPARVDAQLAALRQEVLIRQARTAMLPFTLATNPLYTPNWHHDAICWHLDKLQAGEISRLMIFTPPQHGKSELVSRRFPAYVFGRDPDTKVIATSYGYKLASKMNRDVQRIIDSPTYKQIFPDTTIYSRHLRPIAHGAWLRNSETFEIVNRRGAYLCAGVGGSITGFPSVFGIIDDPIKNSQDAESEAYRETLWDWYVTTFCSRLPKRILITQTRWQEDDLSGRLLKLAKTDPKADKWHVLSLPGIAEEGPRSSWDLRRPGEALWPAHLSIEALERLRALGEYQFAALFQQRPAPLAGNLIKRDWFKFYQALPELDELILSADCTFKDTDGSDYVALHVWGRKGVTKFLVARIHERLSFTATIQAIRTLAAAHPRITAYLIEDKANGPAVISSLHTEIAGILPIDPQGGKIARAVGSSPQLQAGNVVLPDPAIAPWIGEFIDECVRFPNAAHDDDVDAMTQALIWWQGTADGFFQFVQEEFKAAQERKAREEGQS